MNSLFVSALFTEHVQFHSRVIRGYPPTRILCCDQITTKYVRSKPRLTTTFETCIAANVSQCDSLYFR